MVEILEKECTKCHVVKPLTEFRVVNRNSDGKDIYCKQCRIGDYNNNIKEMTNEQIANLERMGIRKVCRMCHVEFPLSEFPVDRSLNDGHKTVCNICIIERNKKYYKSSAESKARYRLAHKSKTNLYHHNQLIKVKTMIMTHYGDGKCSCVLCGESRLPCLTIDHINGGGTKHRRSLNIPNGGGLHFYKWLVDNSYPDGYRTLCWNCQFIVEDEKRQNKYLTK